MGTAPCLLPLQTRAESSPLVQAPGPTLCFGSFLLCSVSVTSKWSHPCQGQGPLSPVPGAGHLGQGGWGAETASVPEPPGSCLPGGAAAPTRTVFGSRKGGGTSGHFPAFFSLPPTKARSGGGQWAAFTFPAAPLRRLPTSAPPTVGSQGSS